jgi:DNA polymerase V
MKPPKKHKEPQLVFYIPDFSTKLELPFVGTIDAGFPSPAEEFIEGPIDLYKRIIKHPAATFYAQARGNSMIDANVEDGDLLVIDKALEPKDGRIAVCYIDGEFTLKRLAVKEDGVYLMPANANFKPIRITEDNDFLIWGMLSYIIKDAK